MKNEKSIYLDTLKDDDLGLMFQWINNREEVIASAPYKPVPIHEHKRWFEEIQKKDDVVIFGIRLIKNNILIGSCQLHSIHKIHKDAELQIRIGDLEQREKGHGSEAMRLLLRFGFKDLNLHRIWLRVFSTNQRAIRLYEKAGFAREGILRQAAFINGGYVDVWVMGMLAEEFRD
ncbi:MAG: GNAT family N-acetyltransferase [Elusimicrobia bacterium]|nr:GNAT family N-acetyltransferase [Elusimicrobiota bacterium]MBK8127282.1 GNAT family N-acetyltransferase [Elusimicrobiota bacterium]MBK9057102.1 GNAT family N-acetyltransferase [Elusimicrobiota bacterium]